MTQHQSFHHPASQVTECEDIQMIPHFLESYWITVPPPVLLQANTHKCQNKNEPGFVTGHTEIKHRSSRVARGQSEVVTEHTEVKQGSLQIIKRSNRGHYRAYRGQTDVIIEQTEVKQR